MKICVIEHYCPTKKKRVVLEKVLSPEDAIEEARYRHQVVIYYRVICVDEPSSDSSWSQVRL